MDQSLHRIGEQKAWLRVNSRMPCPVCGKLKGCLVAADQARAVCLRDGSGKPITWGLGGFLHELQLGTVPTRPQFIPLGSNRKAVPDISDRVYQHLLDGQNLTADHRRHLQDLRQLSSEAIAARGYASWGSQPRAPLARSAFDLFGAVALDVPGVIVRQQKREYITLAGSPGLAIPIRNVKNRIVAIQIRPDQPRPGQGKYNSLSSASRGGASPGTPIHVARPRKNHKGTGRVWLTEGPLKADIACEHLGEIVLAVLGVRALKDLIPTLKELKKRGELRELVIAFDYDWHEKDDVKEARGLAAERAARAGIPIWLADWPSELKGLDDLLLAQQQPRLFPYKVLGNGPRPLEDVSPESPAPPAKRLAVSLKVARKMQREALKKYLATRHRGDTGLLIRSLPGMGKSHALTDCLNEHPDKSLVFVPRHDLGQAPDRENWGAVRGRTHINLDNPTPPCSFPNIQDTLSRLRISGQIGCESCPALEMCRTNTQASGKEPYYHAQFEQKKKITVHPLPHFLMDGLLRKADVLALDDCDLRSLSVETIRLSRPQLEQALDWSQHHLDHAYGYAQPLLSLLVRLLQDVPAGAFQFQEVALFDRLEKLSESFLKQPLDEVIKKASLAKEPDPFSGKALNLAKIDVPVRFIGELVEVLTWEYAQHQTRNTRQWEGWNCRTRLERAWGGQDVELRLTLRRALPLLALKGKRLIIVDASLTLEEAQRLFPGRQWTVIDPFVAMPTTVRIHQYPQQAWGKMRLQNPKARQQALRLIENVIIEHPNQSIGLITHKSLTAEARKLFPDLKIGHFFGQRGSNAFANCDVLIVLGTPNPNPDQLQEHAESLYWDEPTVSRQTCLEPRVFESQPGRPRRQVSVRTHVDPRLRELHRSKCEEELIQAIYRVRPLSVEDNAQGELFPVNRQEATVYLFSSMPLPSLEVQLVEPEVKRADVTHIHQAASVITGRSERITQQRLATQAQITLYRARRFLTLEPKPPNLGPPLAHGPPARLASVS